MGSAGRNQMWRKGRQSTDKGFIAGANGRIRRWDSQSAAMHKAKTQLPSYGCYHRRFLHVPLFSMFIQRGFIHHPVICIVTIMYERVVWPGKAVNLHVFFNAALLLFSPTAAAAAAATVAEKNLASRYV